MKRKNVGLLLMGPVGTGKSFFAGCIANALLEQGERVIPWRMYQYQKTLPRSKQK